MERSEGTGRRIVITGFRAFPGVADNPTQRVIEYFGAVRSGLPHSTLLSLLDVDYRRVVPQIDALLAQPPRALILTGYSNVARAVTLESRASARCAADKPDNAGYVPPPANAEQAPLMTAIDLGRLQKVLSRSNVSASISADAGEYLCNFSYHYALRQIADRALSTQVLFVHLPAVHGSDLAATAAGTMPLDQMAQAIAVIANTLTD
ncbi:pyroglutamyl-peptidase I [Alteraurantiacibacter aestuarii]|uniref:Pyroglutamyl-peptidase I n=1 Tax=Alteraurantiacibacter aestuarii TaxID=650004 RepID=A0A844ZJU4_9SPHN|nr:hypothetical protein [Alteraurantiacibacter aestuarii]MXO87542.1 hypothetical protein [Alteraurantiacibacter aestuarii]